MVVSEKEAETKWCPFVRFASHCDDGNARNRGMIAGQNPAPYALCIGSRCMAWRWLKHPDFAEAWETPVGRCGLSGPAESGK